MSPLVREPDAGNPHVRVDERDVETEHGWTREAPADERAGQRIGPAYATAPHLDSTRLPHYPHLRLREVLTVPHLPPASPISRRRTSISLIAL